uniref:Aminotransferase class V domain-containing protein n=1 Tax=Biomphalaria glabrata TaxID=6526 RepID=A0A2C9L3S0_BIOGL
MEMTTPKKGANHYQKEMSSIKLIDESYKHPLLELQQIASENELVFDHLKFARLMDEKDPLRHLRNEFHYPKMSEILHTDPDLVDAQEDCIYFCGNSLGLCPKKTKEYMDVELDKWAKRGVQGHTTGELPWAWCDEVLEADMAKIVGCTQEEVSIMNGLTVNLHLLLISFYRPSKDRYKILCEDKAFPSDHYTFESQARLHGFNPQDVMICLKPREVFEFSYRHISYSTWLDKFILVLLLPYGIHGCYVGWDLAHAVGNVPLHLHDWQVDFACWCTYKYLNAGAGCLAGLFLHEKHRLHDFPRLMGWWGHNLTTRFKMDN